MKAAHIPAAALALACALALVGCSAGESVPDTADLGAEDAATSEQGTDDGTAADEFVSTAMVVTFGDGEVLFVDQDTEAVYYPTLPDGTPELAAGNLVQVTGNGIMLESYPGQYPGITSVEVIDEGSPEDAEKYADLVAQIWSPRDPSEPAYATIEYRTELAVVSMAPLTCGYTWSFEEGGETRTVAVDAPHPMEIDAADLPDARVDATTEVSASFDVAATDAVVTRRSEEAISADTDAASEDVACEVADGALSFTAEPGYRYIMNVTFDAGTVTYVFTVPAA